MKVLSEGLVDKPKLLYPARGQDVASLCRRRVALTLLEPGLEMEQFVGNLQLNKGTAEGEVFFSCQRH